jgi:multisubunit Na+/H+ antiporter MnhB subunit
VELDSVQTPESSLSWCTTEQSMKFPSGANLLNEILIHEQIFIEVYSTMMSLLLKEKPFKLLRCKPIGI